MKKNLLSNIKKKQSKLELKETKNFVDKKELNLWKRGFTPQAEIWNGRMATVGIGILLIFIALISKFSSI
tara:strand:+ start:1056 stop:1265 length:210 start_codon:yes stop_codon:yes gene_type:complete